MIEILILWKLTGMIGVFVTRKGLAKLPYQIMLVVLWFCGEIGGGVLAHAAQKEPDIWWQIYLLALLSAMVAAWFAFLVARLAPARSLALETNGIEFQPETSSLKKFGQSEGLPALAALAGIGLLLAVVGGVIVYQNTLGRPYHASNIRVGTLLASDGQISKGLTDIDPKNRVIYLGFTYGAPDGSRQALTTDWTINGRPEYSSSKIYPKGLVVMKLDRSGLGLKAFPAGDYTVKVHAGKYLLVSVSFRVSDEGKEGAIVIVPGLFALR